MDILANLKRISVSRLLGFTLISLLRKFIIHLSVPDTCTVVSKGINYDSLLLSSIIQSWTGVVRASPGFVSRRGRAPLEPRHAKPPKHTQQQHSHCFQYEINCHPLHKKFKKQCGDISKPAFPAVRA